MKTYVDGFVFSVPKASRAKYKGKKDAPMPFDMKRFAYGGFTVEVEL